jgi:ribonuclease-3
MEGPPHDPTFKVSVEVEGVETVTAQGASKRAAEQAAATQMLENVTK